MAIALLISAVAFLAGWLTGRAVYRVCTAREFVPLARHREDLLTQRQRYRRRLRALRDACARYKLGEDQLRSTLRTAENHQATQTKLLTSAQAEIAALRGRVAELNGVAHAREQGLEQLRASWEESQDALRAAQDRIVAFESDHGLLRIERDELVARTQRLRTLPPSAADTGPPPAPGDREARAELGSLREELSGRNARIHQLECKLRESEVRMTDLESTLNTWKYRIAPLALHKKLQRDLLRDATTDLAQPVTAPDPGPDDLKRIRGIGRTLEKKLRAEGISRFDQLACMSPVELANLAVRLGIAASRPARDSWAEQAAELCRSPTGTAILRAHDQHGHAGSTP